jgi:predicted SnoaL-like aldol condensation-catalyzing enzyme
MEESAAAFPNKTFEALRALEDGDLVAVHGHVRLTPGSDWIALIHIFRFEDGLIAEEWEAAQMPPENGLNEHGLF